MILLLQLTEALGPPQRSGNLLPLQWLAKVVKCPGLQGGDRGIFAAVSRGNAIFNINIETLLKRIGDCILGATRYGCRIVITAFRLGLCYIGIINLILFYLLYLTKSLV